jgi:CheY-like chemotaxis protein
VRIGEPQQAEKPDDYHLADDREAVDQESTNTARNCRLYQVHHVHNTALKCLTATVIGRMVSPRALRHTARHQHALQYFLLLVWLNAKLKCALIANPFTDSPVTLCFERILSYCFEQYMSRKPPAILVADDDENDLFFLRRAIERAGLSNPLFVSHDGQEAIDYLEGNPPYDNRAQYPLPRLLLLDLKMPRVNGFDVLCWLAQRPDLKEICVVVLSSSAHEEDVQKAKELGAHDFRTKPSEFQSLVELIRDVQRRWLEPSVAAR